MTRALDIWRGWTTRQRLIAVGATALVVAAGAALALYLALKRPADVHNPGAAFVTREAPPRKKKQPKTVDWPVYGYDDERTRYLRTRRVEPPFAASIWSFPAGKLLEFSPIVVDDVLYFMDKDARFYAMNANTGKVKWRRNVGQLNASAPAYARNRLFAVNLEPGQAFALRPRDGKVLWRRPLPGRSESSPVVHNGRVIIGVESGAILALDWRDGSVRWQLQTEGEVKGGLALHNGTLYAGNYAGEVLAINASNGNIRWRNGTQGAGFGRTGRIYSTPAVAFGRVYLGSIDGRVYSFEARTGELAWSHSTGNWVYAAPAVADTPKSPPSVYIGSMDRTFYALDARDGSVRWQQGIGAPILGAASVIGETVYVSGLEERGTFGFRVRDGKQVFRHELGRYNPAISDGQRLYLTGASTLRAFEPRRRGNRKARSKRKAEGRPGAGARRSQRGSRDRGGAQRRAPARDGD